MQIRKRDQEEKALRVAVQELEDSLQVGVSGGGCWGLGFGRISAEDFDDKGCLSFFTVWGLGFSDWGLGIFMSHASVQTFSCSDTHEALQSKSSPNPRPKPQNRKPRFQATKERCMDLEARIETLASTINARDASLMIRDDEIRSKTLNTQPWTHLRPLPSPWPPVVRDAERPYLHP